MASESSTPAAAKASVLAARKRIRSGAASSELVIVRWRHSPVIPTIARIMMKRPLVSFWKTSSSTLSFVGLGSRGGEDPVSSSEIPIATAGQRDEGARGAQLDQLRAASSGLTPPPLGELEEGLLERARDGDQLGQRDPLLVRDPARPPRSARTVTISRPGAPRLDATSPPPRSAPASASSSAERTRVTGPSGEPSTLSSGAARPQRRRGR